MVLGDEPRPNRKLKEPLVRRESVTEEYITNLLGEVETWQQPSENVFFGEINLRGFSHPLKIISEKIGSVKHDKYVLTLCYSHNLRGIHIDKSGWREHDTGKSYHQEAENAFLQIQKAYQTQESS